MKLRTVIITLFSSSIFAASLSVYATETQDTKAQTANANATEAQSAALSDGEVKKIDNEQGKVTIKHGELKNLGMPGMTMVFRVSDPAMLEKLKVGQKIKFVAENVNGTLTVVKMN